MELELYNTRTRQTAPLRPLEGKLVRMYCCGPTVYHFAHIGNLRTYVFEDVLRRAIQFAGFDVKHVMNITDVGHLSDDGDEGEDKMIKAARERGMSVWDIADHYTKLFFKDCASLNVNRPEVVCPATGHIGEMIELVKTLEAKGYTYAANGNVYFDVSKFPHYNELGQLDKQELRAGARIEVDAGKRNPADFVLWFTNSKFKDQAMIWDSPWGRGYPGWHLECSAMSHKYLGEQFDIHCGGVDHVKVHHTNEIAQTEGATGKHPWVAVWMHGEFLVLNNAKMAKSSGNFLTVDRLRELGFEPLDYRYFLLGAHYRTQLNFTDDNMAAARSARAKLVDRLKALSAASDPAARAGRRALADSDARQAAFAAGGDYRAATARADDMASGAADGGAPLSGEALALFQAFQSHVADDLNMPRALAVVHDALKTGIAAEEKLRLVGFMDQVLGLDLLAEAERRLAADQAGGGFSPAEAAEIEALIQERKAAKLAKDFARGDAIRDSLKARGVALVDTPAGTSYKRV